MQKAIIFPKQDRIDCKGLDERVSMHIYVFFFERVYKSIHGEQEYNWCSLSKSCWLSLMTALAWKRICSIKSL